MKMKAKNRTTIRKYIDILKIEQSIRRKYLIDKLLDGKMAFLIGKTSFLTDFFDVLLDKNNILLLQKTFVKFLNRNIKNFLNFLKNCLFCWSRLSDKKIFKKIYKTFFDIFAKFRVFEQPLIVWRLVNQKILSIQCQVTESLITFFQVKRLNFEVSNRKLLLSIIIFKVMEVG